MMPRWFRFHYTGVWHYTVGILGAFGSIAACGMGVDNKATDAWADDAPADASVCRICLLERDGDKSA